jgi:signal transduction histidine kinase
VDLGELARRVVEEQGEPAPALVCPDGVQVHADPRLLRLALHNLLGNARKFTRGVSHPRIELACDASGSEPVYSIADNGVGFGGIEPSRLFRPFVQGHDPGRYGGSGVGLTIVAQVIARHGGRVWAESPPQGGAVFRFTLGQGTDQHSYGSAAGGSHDA